MSSQPINCWSERQDNEAYLAAKPGQFYALYFTERWQSAFGPFPTPRPFQLTWVNIQNGHWGEKSMLAGGRQVLIEAPCQGNWVAAIVRETDS